MESLFLVASWPICCWFPRVCRVFASPNFFCFHPSILCWRSKKAPVSQNSDMFKPNYHPNLDFISCMDDDHVFTMVFFSMFFGETQPFGHTKKQANTIFAPGVPRGAFVENPQGLGPSGGWWYGEVQHAGTQWDLLREMRKSWGFYHMRWIEKLWF